MGKRIKDTNLLEQTSFSPSLRLLVDKMDADPGLDWLQARSMQLKYLGNTYFQGSTNNVNWHDGIVPADTYIQFTTDGGTNWRALSTANIREVTNLYFTTRNYIFFIISAIWIFSIYSIINIITVNSCFIVRSKNLIGWNSAIVTILRSYYFKIFFR